MRVGWMEDGWMGEAMPGHTFSLITNCANRQALLQPQPPVFDRIPLSTMRAEENDDFVTDRLAVIYSILCRCVRCLVHLLR